MKAAVLINVPTDAPTTLNRDYASMRTTSANLVHHSLPASQLALANTIATGVYPSKHGITACSWPFNSETIEAFSDNAQPLVSNLADSLLREFPDALTVSASANPKYAKTFSPSIEKNKNLPHVITTSYEESMEAFTAGFSNSRLHNSFNRANLISEATLENIGVTMKSPTLATYDDATFDLTNVDDIKFLSEIVYFARISSFGLGSPILESVHDKSPDMFVFSYSALKSILAKEINSSTPRAIAALDIVNKQIQQITSEISSQYNDRVISAINYLGTSNVGGKDVVKNIIQNYYGNAAVNMDSYPLIDISPMQPAESMLDLSAPLQPCHDADFVSSLTNAGYAISCPQSSFSTLESLEATEPTDAAADAAAADAATDAAAADAATDAAAADATTDATTTETTETTETTDATDKPTTDDIIKYQIVLWISIGLAFVLYYIADFLAFMDFKRDPALYNSLSASSSKKSHGNN